MRPTSSRRSPSSAACSRSGGSFIVVDAWRTERFETAPDVVRKAATDVEQAMAVATSHTLADWIDVAAHHGFQVTENLDLTEQIKPNLARLAGAAGKYLDHPRLGALARLMLPGDADRERDRGLPDAADRGAGRAHVPAHPAPARLTSTAPA